ncbi:MAG: agmatinase [Geitlerinemataceae cyanobacterium]
MDSDSGTRAALDPFLDRSLDFGLEDSRVVVLPVPYEATTTYVRGCQHGPAALLEASDQLEYYDVELGCEVGYAVGIHRAEPVADTRSGAIDPAAAMAEIADRVCQLRRAGKFVIAIGGEHAITGGVVAGYRQALGDEPFTVVQIDAHGDLRDSYEGSRYNHACVMRRVLELDVPIVPVGIRSICQEEAELIRDRQIPTIWAHEIARDPDWIDRAIAAIPTDKVFLTIDLDGLDATVIPGVGTPQPGGLGWYETLDFVRRLFTEKTAIGMDVMELCPIAGLVYPEFTAAKLVYRAIGYQAKARGWI